MPSSSLVSAREGRNKTGTRSPDRVRMHPRSRAEDAERTLGKGGTFGFHQLIPSRSRCQVFVLWRFSDGLIPPACTVEAHGGSIRAGGVRAATQVFVSNGYGV